MNENNDVYGRYKNKNQPSNQQNKHLHSKAAPRNQSQHRILVSSATVPLKFHYSYTLF